MSRSGTTMLTVLMDSHPDIAMCYDVVPQPMDRSLGECADIVDEMCARFGLSSVDDVMEAGVFKSCKQYLREAGGKALARQFVVTRRSMLAPSVMRDVFRKLVGEGLHRLEDDTTRMYAGAQFVEARRSAGEREYSGLKAILNPSIVNGCFSDALWLFIFRDPRDVYASHKRLEWSASPEEICTRWNGRLGRLRAMRSDPGVKVHALRMEDLLTATEQTLRDAFDFLRLPYFDCAREYASSAPVFTMERAFNSHVQAFWESGLDSSKVGVWRDTLEDAEAGLIEKRCRAGMSELGYL